MLAVRSMTTLHELPQPPSDAVPRQQLLETGQWSDLDVAFMSRGRLVASLSLHRAIVARCAYFWRALQPGFGPAAGDGRAAMRLELPVAPETAAAAGAADGSGAWTADDVRRFMAWVYTDSACSSGAASWQGAWTLVMGEFNGRQPLSAAAVASWLRQHALAQYLGFEAYAAGIEQVLGGWHLNAISEAVARTTFRTDRFNDAVGALLAACAADPEGRRRLLLRVAAWATTVLASLDAADPRAVRSAWIEALHGLCGPAVLNESMFLAPDHSIVAIVCDRCFTRAVPSDAVEQVKLDRLGRWRLLRTGSHMCLMTMGKALDAHDVEFALLDSAKGVTTALLRATGQHGYDVPASLGGHAGFHGRCMHCGSKGAVHVAALRTRSCPTLPANVQAA